MNILVIAMSLFIFLEISNVLLLYFQPGSKKGNGLGVFTAWEKSKQDPEVHNLLRYMAYWVAGTKVIFIGLILVIIFTGSDQTQLATVGVLILTILSFFWRLFPLIRQLDREHQIEPQGYSKTLGIIISIFLMVFVVAFVVSLI